MQQYGGTDPEKEELYQMLRQQYDQLNGGPSMEEASEQARREKLISGMADAGRIAGAALSGAKHDSQPYFQAMRDANDPIKEAEAAQQKRLLLAKALYDKRHQSDMLAYNLEKDRKQMELLAGKQGYEKEQDALKNKLAQDRLDLDRQKISQTSAGQKVTAGTAKEVGEIDAAIKMAEQLEQNYKDKASGTGASIASFFPGTDADLYEKQRDVAAQTIGSILEGGKLTEEDYKRYRSMLPRPTDTNSQAQAKMAAIKGLILEKKRGAIGGLESSGFNVSGFGTIPQSIQTNIDTEGQAMAEGGKTIAKKQYSPSRNQTRIVYSDGTEEIVDGKR